MSVSDRKSRIRPDGDDRMDLHEYCSERNMPMAVSSMMRCLICYIAPESVCLYEDYSEKLALFIIDMKE